MSLRIRGFLASDNCSAGRRSRRGVPHGARGDARFGPSEGLSAASGWERVCGSCQSPTSRVAGQDIRHGDPAHADRITTDSAELDLGIGRDALLYRPRLVPFFGTSRISGLRARRLCQRQTRLDPSGQPRWS